MSSTLVEPRAGHNRRSLLLVFLCTIINAASQILIKSGSGGLGTNPTLIQTALGILLKPGLFAGYALLGLSTVLLVMALREGELSLLYPVFSLSYVWVTILSVIIFHDSLNPFKVIGILIIISGVGILGKAQTR